MATAGQLIIEIAANSAAFRTELAKTRNDLGAFVGQVRAVGAALSVALGGISIAGLTRMVKSALETGDALDEMARRVGFDVEQLQELQHAARISGSSIEGLEIGLRTLNKQLGEAAQGGAEALKFFASIGISVTDTAGALRSTEDVLGDFADKLAATASPALQARMATEAFGREGTRLIPMLSKGRAGLKEAADEAHRMGIVLDRELIAQSSKLNDEFDALSSSIKNNLTRALVAAGPALVGFTRLLAEAGTKVGDFFNAMRSQGEASTEELKKRLTDLQRKIEELSNAAATAPSLLDSLLGKRGGQPSGALAQRQLEALRKQAEDIRGILSGREAAKPGEVATPIITPEMQKTLNAFRSRLIAQAANDPITRAILGVREDIAKAIETAPALRRELEAVGDALEEVIIQAEILKRESATMFGTALEESLFGATFQIEPSDLDDIERAFGLYQDWQDRVTKYGATFQIDHDDLQNIERAFDRYHQTMTETQFGASFKIEPQDLANINDAVDRAEALRTETQFGAVFKITDPEDIERINRAFARVSEIRPTMRDLNREMEAINGQAQIFGMHFDRVGAELQATTDAITRLLRAGVDPLNEEVQKLGKRFQVLATAQLTGNLIENAFTRAGDSIVDAFVRGEGAALRFEDIVKGILASIASDLAKLAIRALIVKAIQTAIGVIGGGGAAAPNIQTQALQHGGVVTRPTFALVGEAGPEAVIPLDRLGSGELTVNIINQNGSQVDAQERTGPDGRRVLEVLITNAVNSAIARGATDRTMSQVYGLTRRGVTR